MNALYLTTYGIGVPFHLYVTKDMPVAKPEDLNGLRFRGQPNYNAIFKHYGIAGVNIAAPEVYTALERGTVQGYGWPLWGINDFGWDKLTKMRVDPGFYNVVNTVLMNKDKYDALAPAQRKVLDDAVVWFENDDLRYTETRPRRRSTPQAKAGVKAGEFRAGVEKDRGVALSGRISKSSALTAIAKLQPLLTK